MCGLSPFQSGKLGHYVYSALNLTTTQTPKQNIANPNTMDFNANKAINSVDLIYVFLIKKNARSLK